MMFYSHFSSILITLKFTPKLGHFGPFCLGIAIAKWPFLPLLILLLLEDPGFHEQLSAWNNLNVGVQLLFVYFNHF